MQPHMLNVLFLLLILVGIHFDLSDQFLRIFVGYKGVKILKFDILQRLSLSKENDNALDFKSVEENETIETERKGKDLWERIENNFNEFNEQDRKNQIELLEKYFTKKSLERLIDDDLHSFETKILDFFVFGIKNEPMNEEEVEVEELKATIDFFIKNRSYSQLACLIIHYPFITTEQLLKVTGAPLTNLFEHLFMMNPDKLDMFFELNNKNYEFAIISLLSCDSCIPKKFDELVEKIIHNYNSNNQDMNVKLLSVLQFKMRMDFDFNRNSYNNSEYILHRNKKLVEFLDSILPEENTDDDDEYFYYDAYVIFL